MKRNTSEKMLRPPALPIHVDKNHQSDVHSTFRPQVDPDEVGFSRLGQTRALSESSDSDNDEKEKKATKVNTAAKDGNQCARLGWDGVNELWSFMWDLVLILE